jgi:hypothetical protein
LIVLVMGLTFAVGTAFTWRSLSDDPTSSALKPNSVIA